VELPRRVVDLLVRFLEQGDGKLSGQARQKEFAALTEAEVDEVETLDEKAFGDPPRERGLHPNGHRAAAPSDSGIHLGSQAERERDRVTPPRERGRGLTTSCKAPRGWSGLGPRQRPESVLSRDEGRHGCARGRVGVVLDGSFGCPQADRRIA